MKEQCLYHISSADIKMETDDDDIDNNHYIRYYFNTHVTSIQLHQFLGDYGYVATPNDQLNIGPGDRIVRVGIGKKLTDVRGLDKEDILAIIPRQDGIRVTFDVLKGNYPEDLDLLEVRFFKSPRDQSALATL